MKTATQFTVIGEAQTKGSTKGFVVRRASGKLGVAITNDNEKEKPWAARVIAQAEKVAPQSPWQGPVGVSLVFYRKRPKRCGLKRVEVRSTTKPDIDKLIRSFLDACTGYFWLDDAQVTELHVRKLFADVGTSPRVDAAIWEDEEFASQE